MKKKKKSKKFKKYTEIKKIQTGGSELEIPVLKSKNKGQCLELLSPSKKGF